MPTPHDGLLLDIGDVIVSVPWQAFDRLEAETGRKVPGRGPLDPEGDPWWQERMAGTISGEEYWNRQASAAGFENWHALFRKMSEVAPDEQFDQDAVALLREARAARRRVGVLSNDAYLINGPEYFASRPEFQDLDAFVDATALGVRKPAAGAYLGAADAMGLPPERIVFLDDTPACVDGARAVGMAGVHVDPLDKAPAFQRARELLGLVPESRAARLVREAEAAYAAQDLEAVLRLFHPDAIAWWNGQKVASGMEELRRFHVERLGFDGAPRPGFRLRKTLRAAECDTIAVEWAASVDPGDGPPIETRAAEFWTMRGDLVVEWHAYQHRVDDGARRRGGGT
jgi:putative hydrolase of the HAD superfamily